MSNTNQNIYPKPCVYNCGIQIYWNTLDNAYFEVFTKKRHLCPNRVNKLPSVPNNTSATVGATTTNNTKPTYYSKKPWNTQPKPKMSNSFELLTGPIETFKRNMKFYQISITEYNGKIHGSQSHNVTNNSMQLIVYYEVPLEQRDEVKESLITYSRNNIVIQRNY